MRILSVFITAQISEISAAKWHSATRTVSYIGNRVENGVYIIHKMASQSTSGKISDLYELKEELGK